MSITRAFKLGTVAFALTALVACGAKSKKHNDPESAPGGETPKPEPKADDTNRNTPAPGGTESPGGTDTPGGTETPGGAEKPGGTEHPGGDQTPVVTFEMANTVFLDHCKRCHENEPRLQFIGKPDVVKDHSKELQARVTGFDENHNPVPIMPPKDSVRAMPLTDAQRQMFVAYRDALAAGVATPSYDEMMPILSQSCENCHSAQRGRNPKFVGDKAVFDSNIGDIVKAVTTTDKNEAMPPIAKTQLTDDEKNTVLTYLKSVQ